MDIQTAKQIRIADFLHSLGSVSYTHLDVYKRQAYSKEKFEPCIPSCPHCIYNMFITVSYTHLDVYKRQIQFPK